jgi:putative transposase
MPPRQGILATGETYHVFNRGLHHEPIFTEKREFRLLLDTAAFYLQSDPSVKFSYYRQQPNKYEVNLEKTLVNIHAYAIMPSHFHFLLTQKEEGGIRKFIHRLSSSYSKYFDIKHDQKGPVFEARFKTVRVGSQEQLTHLSRYIHLNPVTAFLVESPEDYEFSSYKCYVGLEKSSFVDPSLILDSFSSDSYKDFVMDQKDYQRELKTIDHLTLE